MNNIIAYYKSHVGAMFTKSCIESLDPRSQCSVQDLYNGAVWCLLDTSDRYAVMGYLVDFGEKYLVTSTDVLMLSDVGARKFKGVCPVVAGTYRRKPLYEDNVLNIESEYLLVSHLLHGRVNKKSQELDKKGKKIDRVSYHSWSQFGFSYLTRWVLEACGCRVIDGGHIAVSKNSKLS